MSLSLSLIQMLRDFEDFCSCVMIMSLALFCVYERWRDMNDLLVKGRNSHEVIGSDPPFSKQFPSTNIIW